MIQRFCKKEQIRTR